MVKSQPANASESPIIDRNMLAITLQADFLKGLFRSWCEKMGMEQTQAEELFYRFFGGIGDLLRKTDMDADRFEQALHEIGKNMLRHTADYCTAMKERGAASGWADITRAIHQQSRAALQIDGEERRAYHDVHFPVPAERDEPAYSTRIRHVIHLDVREGPELDADLSDLADKLRTRMRGIFSA